jgi:hypothetical protein
MIVYECFFKDFYSRGSNDYLIQWAAQVDLMTAEGWNVLDCCRDQEHPGFWTTILERPGREGCRQSDAMDSPVDP